MSDLITITVHGRPAPQGSKRAFAVRSKGVPTGRVAVIESSHDRVKSWRQAVMDAATAVKAWPALDGPLEVTMTFVLPRPASHYGTGKNAHRLKPAAPVWPVKPPDCGKLARATEDALTCAGIYRDDAQIVVSHLTKIYERRGPFTEHLPGAVITIRPATGGTPRRLRAADAAVPRRARLAAHLVAPPPLHPPGVDAAGRLPTMRRRTTMTMPQAAIDVFVSALGHDLIMRSDALAALEAAAPHIAAAERERIRQLAIANGAACTSDEGTGCWFADLIEPAP